MLGPGWREVQRVVHTLQELREALCGRSLDCKKGIKPGYVEKVSSQRTFLLREHRTSMAWGKL